MSNTLPLTLTGTVVHGDKRGKQLGFPTANIEMPYTFVLQSLKSGVYYGELMFDGEKRQFVMSYGKNVRASHRLLLGS